MTGPLDMAPNELVRSSVAIVMGSSGSVPDQPDTTDLMNNLRTTQKMAHRKFQGSGPPKTPVVQAIPSDRKVRIVWDSAAENSVDALTGKNDFEGYTIYRSTDPQFLDQQTITDAFGSKFLFTPLEMVGGASAKFDLDNEYHGLSNILYTGHGTPYNLGNNTGLRHTFIDSNKVVNGQNYYYAVVSYDHGDEDLIIAPVLSKGK